MHTKHRLGHLLIIFGVFSWMALSIAVNYTPAKAAAISASTVFNLSNQKRTANGLPALTQSSALNTAAAQKAAHMRDNGYFAHTAPDGTTGWQFIASNGYSYTNAGENLASSNQGATAVVDGWMNSPGHRANLLSSTYTEVGHGSVYVGSWTYNGATYSDTYFVVALYALPTTPTPPPPAPEPEPEPEPTVTPPVEEITTPPATQQTPEPDPEPEPQPEIAEQVVEPEPQPENQIAETAVETPTEVVRPVASVAPSEDGLISPRLAIALATVGLGIIVTGVILEIRWIKRHGHVQHIHLPHL